MYKNIFFFLLNLLSNISHGGLVFTAKDIGQSIPMNIIHPFCGRSEGFANHRQPKLALFTTTSRHGRIINGIESNKNAWPWQVSLELDLSTHGKIGHWCGGVLIHSSWILTAAHCVENKLVRELGTEVWTAVLGSGHRSFQNLVSLPIIKIVVHPKFANYDNDIALLKIPWDPQLQHYAPVCLPISSETKNETFHGINCVATGWGRTEMSGPLQDRLRHVELKVIDNQHCADMYGMKYNIKVDQDMHLCAGPILSGGKGTCIGDSGGPLQCNMKDGRWYLAGLTSFGSGCAKPGFPDVFTRLTHYIEWINSTLALH